MGRGGFTESRSAQASRTGRSRAIPERLGFSQEGVVREAERIGDRYVDQVVYAKLATDWLAHDR
ncbi:MAG TPA: GNAT family protein [Solirubrobacteraceae bacterium]|nr:GNAT family protein [Solirubrobacteraceae bacterium]